MSTPSARGNEAPLSYDIALPDPLPAGELADIRITITNTGSEPVDCVAVPVGFAAGTEDKDLAEEFPELDFDAVDQDGWTVRPAGEPGGYEIVPVAGGSPLLGPLERIELTVAGIRVNAKTGNTTIRVGKHHKHVYKSNEKNFIESFAPDSISVENGGQTTLTWKCSKGPEYTLYYNYYRGGQYEPRKLLVTHDYIDEKGNGSWPTPELYQTLGFMLLASWSEDNRTRTIGRTTAVTVDLPDMSIGDLDANGLVSLLGTPLPIPVKQGEIGSYRAETDGFLTGWVKTKENDRMASLAVTVTPPAPTAKRVVIEVQSFTSTGGRKNQDASLLVPVQKGAGVRVVPKTDSELGLDAEVTWHPLGTGDLAPATSNDQSS